MLSCYKCVYPACLWLLPWNEARDSDSDSRMYDSYGVKRLGHGRYNDAIDLVDGIGSQAILQRADFADLRKRAADASCKLLLNISACALKARSHSL